MMDMAPGHVKAGRIEQMRSLVKPIHSTGRLSSYRGVSQQKPMRYQPEERIA